MNSCNVSKEWIDHGGRVGIKENNLENSPTIFVAQIELINKKAIAFTSGDVDVPISWEIQTQVFPKVSIKNKRPKAFKWDGRYRLNHPDPTKEDLFWDEWLNEQREVIMFLDLENENIIHVEIFSEERVMELQKTFF